MFHFFSRSLQLTERSPNRTHKILLHGGANPNPNVLTNNSGQHHANSNHTAIYATGNMRATNNFPSSIRTTGKSQSIHLTASNSMANGSGNGHNRNRQNDVDKSRSFDFDYCNYNTQNNVLKSQQLSNNSLSVLNREAAMRLDFDKSRSFDEDYRDALVASSNNNLNTAALRYLQASQEAHSSHRLRRSSPVEGSGGGGGSGGRNTRSPQSSGSSCNNLSVPNRTTTSPQNYGTRLCDHELTYDLMRKSLDRSPIMEFRRGDSSESRCGGDGRGSNGGSSGGAADYDIPIGLMRNRETINSGGNSELNFMNNDSRNYELPTAGSKKQQQRALRRTHSPNESQYSLERMHSSKTATSSSNSREEMTPPETLDYRADYNDIYRRTRDINRSNNRGRY